MKSLILAIVLTACTEAAVFHVDPEYGSPAGDGSADDPWSTLQEVIEANLIETRAWASHPPDASTPLEIKNEGAPVKGGDTLLCYSGYHGNIYLLGAYNTDWITVMAPQGEKPACNRIHLRSGAQWRFIGLTVSPSYADTWETATLVDIESHGWHGSSYSVAVEACTLFSVSDAGSWADTDWNERACNGINADGPGHVLRNNVIRNINFALSANGDSTLVEGNTIVNFSGDGLRGLGNYQTFRYNTVKNCYDVNGNHDDGFQSWSATDDGVGTGEVVGMVISGNVIINYEDPDQPYRGTLQGIGCFDGFFVDWIVENNIIMTDHWHGITLNGARNCRIVNNTVVDLNTSSPGPPWIRIWNHKDGRPSSGCSVRNNLTTDLSIHEDGGVAVDHNIIVEDYETFFEDYAAGDLKLKEGCPAIDAGSINQAPERDIGGTTRPLGEGVDVGAWEWIPPAGTAPSGRSPDFTSDPMLLPGMNGWIVRVPDSSFRTTNEKPAGLFSLRGEILGRLPAVGGAEGVEYRIDRGTVPGAGTFLLRIPGCRTIRVPFP